MSFEIGKKLINQKKYKKAFYIFSKLLEKNPNDFKANFHIGKYYYDLNNINKSVFFFQKSNKLKPNNPNIIFNLAVALQGIGQTEEAKKKYLKLILMNSKDIRAYYGLFVLDVKNITYEFYQNLQSIIKEKSLSLYEKGLINFIFSKLAKKDEKIKEEIDYLKLAHESCYESNLIYNKQSDYYYKEIISNHYNKFLFQNKFLEKSEFNNQKHIFIIGLPRSGSSLVETIISHNAPNITTVGEFHGFNRSILEQVGRKLYSKNFEMIIDKKKFQDALLERYDNFNNKIYLDKSLENFFNIEIILEFFPNAKFIHTYRNYKDAVIGIYQAMLPELSWSHKIKNIVQYIEIYNKIINYFRNKYPEKILNVELSKLSNQKETEAKKILEFCNINFSKESLNFDKNEKLSSKTSSFLQVRNKIQKYEHNKYQPYYHLIN
jgi:tetratricopeptide (TPR) repeat protein